MALDHLLRDPAALCEHVWTIRPEAFKARRLGRALRLLVRVADARFHVLFRTELDVGPSRPDTVHHFKAVGETVGEGIQLVQQQHIIHRAQAVQQGNLGRVGGVVEDLLERLERGHGKSETGGRVRSEQGEQTT